MTFLEKAMEIENGTNLSKRAIVECSCPHDYEMEEIKDCDKVGYENCIDCWNREMPNTEEKVDEDKEWIDGYEKGKIDGLNDAWELICKINKLSTEESERVYGKRFQYITDIIENLTPQEALAKLKAYEDSKIEVGDVVENIVCGEVFVGAVSNVDYDVATVMWGDGTSGLMKKNELKKTGKHIDISSILKQIGE